MTVPKFKKFRIKAYKPGKSKIGKVRNIIKLSANESALGVSPKVKKLLNNKNLILSKYPDSMAQVLRKEISNKYNCDFNKIICGAGSDEIIQMICQLYLKSSDEVIVPQYSFLMYRIYAQIVGAKVVFSKEKNFRVSVVEIIKKVSKKTKIVFIANPNNPTGTYLNKLELLELRKKLKRNILLVMDDAYFEYMKNKDYKSSLDLFKNKDNVVVIRTFSKIYGLASLRVGWGYGSKKIILGADCINLNIAISGWQEVTDIDVSTFIMNYLSKGVQYVICTDVSKDGMLCGPSFDLYKHILTNSDKKIKLIASGGISTFEELPKLLDLGCEGVIIGKALYENRISLKQLESFILNQ